MIINFQEYKARREVERRNVKDDGLTENQRFIRNAERLTPNQVLEIYNRAKTGRERQADIALDYGITAYYVSAIKNGYRERWNAITGQHNINAALAERMRREKAEKLRAERLK